MSDSVKKYYEMVENGEINKNINYVARDNGQYIYVLNFEDGNVYRYDISVLGNEGNGWNPDTESCEAFLYGCGHKISNIEWMVTTEEQIIKR